MYEWMRKHSERQADIDAELQKAEIRTRSQALVWTGPADELTATIHRWFASGWLPGASLDDALRLVSLHFVGPNGLPIIQFDPVPAVASMQTSGADNPRKAFVLPLLEKKGWSIYDWAIESNVASATAHDYLANKTTPYRSTLLKLSQGLGVSVQQLPK